VSVEEKNKALIRRFFEALDEGNLDAIEEMLAPDFVDHSPLPDQEPGREGYKLLLAEDRAALSDVRTTIEYQATDGDDLVISRVIMRSIHDRGVNWHSAHWPRARVDGYPHPPHSRGPDSRGVERVEWPRIARMEKRLEEEARERERVEQELRVARRIQQASLPKEVPALGGWEVVPYYQPAC
jgi:SnoaL-like polyketide cyclase